MKYLRSLPALLGLALCLSGCATTPSRNLTQIQTEAVQRDLTSGQPALSRELEDKILALNPGDVTGRDVEEVLSQAPAPRMIGIHGGIYPVYLCMKSFSRFLVGMGYPEASVRNPSTGAYSVSCYENSEKIAGMIAWYYEHEKLRPVIVGHSQGGIQAIKVLQLFAGYTSESLHVCNPLTKKTEDRTEIIDPLTGEPRPVVGLQLPYATAVGAGGLTRLMPNQWGMWGRLRKIPDTVEDFTGFYIGTDLIGGDFLGFGAANHYHPNGHASVRNVRLPASYSHVTVPATSHLAESQEIQDWINRYTPTEEPKLDVKFDSSSKHILWAADVWYSIKKHWVLELQRYIRARRLQDNGH